jgi:hypothetical protein
VKWRRDREICLMRQNLLNHFRTRISVSEEAGIPKALRVTWSFDACWAAGALILVQCHRIPVCSRLRQRLLDGYGCVIPPTDQCADPELC